jgi:DNA repair protein RecN (Recombination protein N)
VSLIELRIQNLAVIQSGVLNFGSRFSVITGETGSGKSVCVEALKLALGHKADVDAVRSGSDSASVSAVFDEVAPSLVERIVSLGIPQDDLITLTRELKRDGKSSARINGASVSMTVLREIGESLVEVTGQGESYRLLKGARQRDLLDGFGGPDLATVKLQFQEAYAQWRALALEVNRRRELAATQQRDVESAKELVAELEPLNLKVGEEDELRVRVQRFRNGAQLIAAASALKHAIDDEEAGAEEQLLLATSGARKLAALDAGMTELVVAADAVIDQLRDLSRNAEVVLQSIGVDEQELANLESRMDTLERVRRRFGSIENATSELERCKLLLEESADSHSLLELETRLEQTEKEVRERANQLSETRNRAAASLQDDITPRLHDLGLPHAKFVAQVESADIRAEAMSDSGADVVAFLLSANKGGVPAQLDAGPSGGELSRLALALRAVAVTQDDCPTLVLDEVDTGIGGETAARVGEVLSEIGSTRQVIAITHRAEIAARAQHHLEVSKQQSAQGAVSQVTTVEGDHRTKEIARLLSGHPTDAALARALELLADGAKPRRRALTSTIA